MRTRDHTEVALREFGANVKVAKGEIRIEPRPKLQPRQLDCARRSSSAVFLIGAALVLPESSLMLHNVGLNPTRSRVLDFLISIGASINLASVQLRDGELIGDVSVRHAPLVGGSISGPQVAEMIDELPMLAALGPFTEKGIEIHDAQELRVKESDRIAALAEGLRQMGARVEEFPDGLRVEGRGVSAGEATRSCGARKSIRRAIIGLRWRWQWPRWAQREIRLSATRIASAFHFRIFSRRWSACGAAKFRKKFRKTCASRWFRSW